VVTAACLEVFPGAKIQSRRVDEEPIRVTIQAELPTGGDTVNVWSGDQKGLFAKNGHRALPAINGALQSLKAKMAAAAEEAEEGAQDEE
jgi:hypothetical protein